MKYILSFIFFLIWLSFTNESVAQYKKPRVIVTTDGEIDDRRSMIRFLMYANEFDIKGLIHSSSKFHWKGNEEVEGHNWKDVDWLEKRIDAYEKVFNNLKLHDPYYPTPKYLKDQIYIGNIEVAGDMKFPTPGSERIVEVLLEPDTSTLWLQAWGGTNTIARALKTIEEQYPEKMKEISAKTNLFMIIEQDETFQSYILTHWPKLNVIVSYQAFVAVAYSWKKVTPPHLHTYFGGEWMKKNILDDHGYLCELYEYPEDGGFRSEGDSPSFLYLIDVGLGDPKHPDYGSWGGRFVHNGKYWVDAKDDADVHKTVYRWIPSFQNDWAAKADWCVKAYEEANHPPQVRINLTKNISKQPGSKVELSAVKSFDPDDDPLDFRWWQYGDADSYPGKITIENPEQREISFVIPSDAKDGDTIHIICEVTDHGTPPLTRYKRIIVHVKSS